MPTHTERFQVETRGNAHILDLTTEVQDVLADTGVVDGIATVFVIGSTAAITTTEYEPGLVNHDLAAALEILAPEDGSYQHEATWNDDNGHSHVRASLIGPALTVPVIDGDLVLGTWQQIVLMDFDTRPRTRTIVVTILGD